MPIYLVGPYPYHRFEKARRMAVYLRTSSITRMLGGKVDGIFDMENGKWLETEEELIEMGNRMEANLTY